MNSYSFKNGYMISPCRKSQKLRHSTVLLLALASTCQILCCRYLKIWRAYALLNSLWYIVATIVVTCTIHIFSQRNNFYQTDLKRIISKCNHLIVGVQRGHTRSFYDIIVILQNSLSFRCLLTCTIICHNSHIT